MSGANHRAPIDGVTDLPTDGLDLDAAVAYHDAMAAVWSESYSRVGFRKRLVLFRSVLNRTAITGQSWVDLGCGSGVLTRELIRLGTASVVAIDASPAMLAHAATTTDPPAGVNVSWIRGDAQSARFLEGDAFDGVVCSSVIEYVERPADLLAVIGRVLRPNGRFVVSVPPKGSLVRSLQKSARWTAQWFGRDPFPYLSVSRFEMEPRAVPAYFRSVGLSVCRISKFDPVLPRQFLGLVRPSLLVVEGRKTGGM